MGKVKKRSINLRYRLELPYLCLGPTYLLSYGRANVKSVKGDEEEEEVFAQVAIRIWIQASLLESDGADGGAWEETNRELHLINQNYQIKVIFLIYSRTFNLSCSLTFALPLHAINIGVIPWTHPVRTGQALRRPPAISSNNFEAFSCTSLCASTCFFFFCRGPGFWNTLLPLGALKRPWWRCWLGLLNDLWLCTLNWIMILLESQLIQLHWFCSAHSVPVFLLWLAGSCRSSLHFDSPLAAGIFIQISKRTIRCP